MKLPLYVDPYQGLLDWAFERPDFQLVGLHEAKAVLAFNDVHGRARELRELARINGIPFIIVQHGAMASMDFSPEDEHAPYRYEFGADAFLAWGPSDVENIRRGGSDKAYLCGCPLTDYLPQRNPNGTLLFLPAHWDRELPENEEALDFLIEAGKKVGKRVLVKGLKHGGHNRLLGKDCEYVYTEPDKPGHIEAVKKALKEADLAVTIREGTAELLACAMDVPLIQVNTFRPTPLLGKPSYGKIVPRPSDGALTVEKAADLLKAVERTLSNPEEFAGDRKSNARLWLDFPNEKATKHRMAEAVYDVVNRWGLRVRKGAHIIQKTKVLGLYTDGWTREHAPGACGHYRITNPAKWVNKLDGDFQMNVTGYVMQEGPGNEAAFKAWAKLWLKHDIILTQKVDSLDGMALIHACHAATRKPLVVDFDDDNFNLDPFNPVSEALKPGAPTRFILERFLTEADAMIVENRTLRESVGDRVKEVFIRPNAVDPEFWPKRSSERTDGDIRVGWAGSQSHSGDLYKYIPIVAKVVNRFPNVSFHAAGGLHETYRLFKRLSFYGQRQHYQDYAELMRNMDLDIAIAPLSNTRFNKAKSPIKWMENGLLETPMVLSSFQDSPYRRVVEHEKTGFMSSELSFDYYLERLIEREDERKQMGKAAREAALKLDPLSNARLLCDIFKRILNVGVRSRLAGDAASV